MRHNILLAAVSALAVVVVADFKVDPAKIDDTKKNQWCLAEQNSCQQLCGGSFKTNDCDPVDLAYKCVCTDGTSPELSKYTGTMPTFTCQQAFEDCINEHIGQAQEQANCTKSIHDKCGTLDPAKAEIKQTTTSSAAPSTTNAAAATTTPASSTSTAGAAIATHMALIGNSAAAVAVGVFAAALL
ncbi:hypothetical protein B0H66DRAFT_34829 [Apodospora peruviana]|uniref:DUF7707 domain-containing protein n=1 Tax=Apodospora peruviana TaxID=516989 RepID=A0AAE0IR06_9PEZI|nr:hypothetical protein B0H66DRAFT_34829 [Apodospora peruviana]